MYLDFLSDILFPPACVGCSTNIAHGVLCDECRAGVSIYKTIFCGVCRARLPGQKKICHQNAPYMLGTATDYDNPIAQRLIHALKFHGIKDAAAPLADILISYITSIGIDIRGFIIVPIPLSKKRVRGRGFNQSTLIARGVADHFSLPLDEQLLIRTLHRPPQSETYDLAERKENLRGVFALHHTGAAEGKHIILLDDVTTSGTTFLEAARILKAGGARKIFALAVAQA